MKNMPARYTPMVIISIILLLLGRTGYAENIDPNFDGSQYIYAENVGWLNLEPAGNEGPGVDVRDTKLAGYIWGKNVGWIDLDPQNGGVDNDGEGNLSGFAWGENIGWLSFSCKNTNSCASVDYGVTINPASGKFSGKAWGENIGWVNFAPNGHTVKTSWRGDSDGDGFTDDVDNCPNEDSSGNDPDQDGCLG